MIVLWLVSDIVVIAVYNVYACISLVKLKFSFLFFRFFATGFIIPVNKDYLYLQPLLRSAPRKLRNSVK